MPEGPSHPADDQKLTLAYSIPRPAVVAARVLARPFVRVDVGGDPLIGG